MKYFFVGKDLTNIEFFNKLKGFEKGYTLINFGDTTEYKNCVNVNPLHGEFTLNFEFIFEYHIKRYGEQVVIDNLIPEAGRLESGMRDILKKDDIIYVCNSGDYCSRLIHKLSEEIGFEFYYLESGYLKDTYMKSKIPFIENKWYGKSDFELNYYSQSDILSNSQFWENYLSSNQSKYLQNIPNVNMKDFNFKEPRHKYDGFFVGQIQSDTSIVLIDSKYKSPEEMTFSVASENPSKVFCYKPHPKIFDFKQVEEIENLKSLPNLDIVFEPIHSLFKKSDKVYCISSTVGLEAILHGKQTVFFGDIWYGKENFYKGNNRIKLMNVIKRSCIPFEYFD